MLFAAEGGGFFSSSALGYSKGISLLLLGQKDEEQNQMKITPWNHRNNSDHNYQLVNYQDSGHHPAELATSGSDHLARRCAFFICFRHSDQRNVSGQQPQEVLNPAGEGKDGICEGKNVDDGDVKKVRVKSNLKKHSTRFGVPRQVDGDVALHEENANIGRRNVQWLDVLGGDLVDIREFEPSEEMSDDEEYDNVNEKACLCIIM
jgi:hypothetical protein